MNFIYVMWFRQVEKNISLLNSYFRILNIVSNWNIGLHRVLCDTIKVKQVDKKTTCNSQQQQEKKDSKEINCLEKPYVKKNVLRNKELFFLLPRRNK